ncbi:MAG: hypothetical protein ACE5JK_07400 [Candidatus Omnitrophota bacterium]
MNRGNNSVLGRKPDEKLVASLVIPYEEEVKAWHEQGICSSTIHEALAEAVSDEELDPEYILPELRNFRVPPE